VTAAALRVEGLCKRFGDSDALCDVSLEVRPREVVGLVGVNGAGKSTLLELIAGVMQPDAGQIKVRGTAVRWRKPRDAADAGIGLMFQEPSLVPGISVAENIMLGHEGAGVRLGVYRWKELCALAQVRLAEVGMNISPAAATQSLSFAERQLVGFAKAIAVEARTREAPVFLLDEPTSALDDQGVAAVLRVVEQLRTRASVVFVSHRLEEVLRVCDRIYVMKDGRCTAERQGRTCTATALQLLMVGQAIGSDAARAARSPSAASPCLEVRQLSRRHAYADVSLVLNHGEVIGITGSAGAGCEEFCRTLFGIVAPHSGTILVDGRAVALRDPADAVALGIGYVPAERTSEGIMGAMSVEANMTLTHLARRGDRKAVSRRCDRHAVQRWIERLRITTTSAGARASDLSGGNQQKVALAKWLIGGQPRVLILDHPLRGLDVLARRDILEIIRELARDGVGIIIVADTLADLMAASDTVIVMRDGRIRARYSMAEDRPTEQTILERMV
jgi:ribose transport system ATP-binding protein